jgi:hypothetical protein
MRKQMAQNATTLFSMRLQLQRADCVLLPVLAASNSSVFTDIIQPFTAFVANNNASPNRPAVAGCTPVQGAPTTTTAKSAASAALPPATAVPPTTGATAAGSGAAAGGRRLMQGPTAPVDFLSTPSTAHVVTS